MADNNATQKEYILKLTAKTEDFTQKLEDASAKLKEAGSSAEKYKQQMEKASKLTGAGLGNTVTELGRVSSEYSRMTSQLTTVLNQSRQYEMEMDAVFQRQKKQSEAVAESKKRYIELSEKLEAVRKKYDVVREASSKISGQNAYKEAVSTISELGLAIDATSKKLQEQFAEFEKTTKALKDYKAESQRLTDEIATNESGAAKAEKQGRKNQTWQRIYQKEAARMEAEAGDRDPREVFGEKYTRTQGKVRTLGIMSGFNAEAQAKHTEAADNARAKYEALQPVIEKTTDLYVEQREAISESTAELKALSAQYGKALADFYNLTQSAGVDPSAIEAAAGEVASLVQAIEAKKAALGSEVADMKPQDTAQAEGNLNELGDAYEEVGESAKEMAESVEKADERLAESSGLINKEIHANQAFAGLIQKTSDTIADARDTAQDYSARIQEARDFGGSDSVNESANDLEGLLGTYKNLAAALTKNGDKMKQYKAEMDELEAKHNQQAQAALNAEAAFAKIKARLDEIIPEYERMKQAEDALGEDNAYTEATQKLKELETELERVTKEYENAAQASKASHDRETFGIEKDLMSAKERAEKSTGEEAAKAKAEVDRLNEALVQSNRLYDEQSSNATGAYEENRADLEKQISSQKAIVDKMRQDAGANFSREEYAETERQVSSLTTTAKSLSREMVENGAAANETATKWEGARSSFIGAAKDARTLARQMGQVDDQMAQTDAAMSQQIHAEEVSQKLAAIGNAFKTAGKKIASGFLTGIKKAAKGLKDLSARAAQAAKSNKLLTAISGRLSKAINGVGNMARRMLMRLAMRAILQDIGNAMKALAKQFEDFNAAMNELGGGTKQLVAQMAAAFGSLIQQISPILNQILDMLINFMNTVTQIFAVLGGSGTWRRAVRGAYDFSGAMDSAAGSAGGAADAQEELNRQLLGFDQIHKLNAPSESSGGGGGGGGAGSGDDGNGAFQWVEEEVPKNDITLWLEKLRKEFEDHDWPGIGKTFADGINGAFAWIQSVTGWEHVGYKINGFIHDLADSFNSLISNLNTYDIGATIGGAVTTVLNTITELEDSIDWDEIGVKLGEGLNGLAERLDLSKATEALSKKFNIIFSVLGNFAETADWDKIGQDIADAINTLISEFDFADFGAALSSFVGGLLESLSKIIGETDWKEVGSSIVRALENIDWKNLMGSLIELIAETLVGAFELVGEAIIRIFGGDDTIGAIEKVTGEIEKQNEKLREGISLYGRYAEVGAIAEMYKTSLINERQAWENRSQAQEDYNEKVQAYYDLLNNPPDTRWMSPEQRDAVNTQRTIDLAAAEAAMEVAKDALDDAQSAYQDAANLTRQYADELYLAQNEYDDYSEAYEDGSPKHAEVQHGTDTVEEIREEQDRNTPQTIVVAQERQQEEKRRPTTKPGLPSLDDAGKSYKEVAKATQSYSAALGETTKVVQRFNSDTEKTKKNLPPLSKEMDKLSSNTDRTATRTAQSTGRMTTAWGNTATGIVYRVQPLTTQIPSLMDQTMRKTEQSITGKQAQISKAAGGITTAVTTAVRGLPDKVNSLLSGGDYSTAGQKAGQSYATGLKNGAIAVNGSEVSSSLKSNLSLDLSGKGWEVGKSYGNALKNAVESTKIKTPQITSKGNTTLSGTNVSVPRYAIEWYAQGGFPDLGQLFIAREAGPEMVGQIGGSPAVANNQQIVEAVSAGVARAVGSVLAQNTSRDESGGGDLVVRIDSEEIYRAALKGQRKVNKRTSPIFATI